MHRHVKPTPLGGLARAGNPCHGTKVIADSPDPGCQNWPGNPIPRRRSWVRGQNAGAPFGWALWRWLRSRAAAYRSLVCCRRSRRWLSTGHLRHNL